MRWIGGFAVLCLLVGMAAAEESKGYKDADVAAAKKLYDKKIQVLDVRTEEEYKAGHIPGAQLIPVQELEERIKEVAAKKKALLLVYCRSGKRSEAASAILVKHGFKNVTNMLGGFNAWSAAGYADEKGAPKPPAEKAETAKTPKKDASAPEKEAAATPAS